MSFIEKRPTCVTVIGWVWIVLGILMLMGSAMAVVQISLMKQMMADVPQDQLSEIPAIFNMIPFIGAGQLLLAVIGIIAGIQFLKLKPWSRTVLEVLTWLMILSILAFMAYFWIETGTMLPADNVPPGLRIMMIIMPVFIFMIYLLPLGIMIRYLRSMKVKRALTSDAVFPTPAPHP